MWEYRENQTVIGWMKKSINRVFGLSESELMIKWEGKPQGGFLIDFRYEPKGFRIRVDRDRLYPVYDIFIYDNEGAENSLHRMTHFDSEFSPEKIDAAFDLLKEVVDNENILLYIFKDDKVYRKTKDGPRRLKDPSEMMTDGPTLPEKYIH